MQRPNSPSKIRASKRMGVPSDGMKGASSPAHVCRAAEAQRSLGEEVGAWRPWLLSCRGGCRWACSSLNSAGPKPLVPRARQTQEH